MLIDHARSAYYHLPESFQRAVLVRRRQPIWIRAGIVFIHVPKAAGTSVNQALYGQFMGHVHASDIQRWGSARLNALPSVAITRNPWDRLVSAYRFAKLGRGIGGKVQAGVRNPRQYQVPAFANFDSFVTQWLAQRDVARLDGIFQPQWPFVCNEDGRTLVDHLGRIEDLPPTLEFIRAASGSAVQLEWSNRSGDANDYRDFYTPDLARLVGQIYRRDVELFGYEF